MLIEVNVIVKNSNETSNESQENHTGDIVRPSKPIKTTSLII